MQGKSGSKLSVSEQVERLKSRNFKPTSQVLLHKDSSGRTSSCCTAAYGSFRSAIVAHSQYTEDGFHGVLQYLQCNYLWGVKRCQFLCDTMSTACHGIDCGSRMAIAELAVQIFLDECLDSNDEKLRNKYEDIRVCSVQVLMNVDASEVSSARTSLQRLYKDRASSYGIWIEDDVFYHQCLGIYSTRTGILNLWDYNAWRRPNSDPHRFYNTILSIYVSPYDRNHDDERSVYGTYMNRDVEVEKELTLSWEGVVHISFNRWIDTCEPGCPRFLQLNNATSFPEKINSSPTTTTDEESRSTVEDSSNSISAIYISGCHMSVNPMPGVGIARCLKQGWGIQCPVLVGVDHLYMDVFSGITDPIFDKCRNIATYGFMRSRSKPCKDPDYIPVGGLSAHAVGDIIDPWLLEHTEFPKETNVHDHDLWESVVSIINNDDNIGTPGGEVYFLPCTDKDIDYFAIRIAWARKLIQADSELKDNRIRNRYRKTIENIICPNKDALEGTLKPEIYGPKSMGCFVTPEYFLVTPPRKKSTQGNEEEYGRLEDTYTFYLAEAQAFCDRIGYPVMVKGVQGGHALCNGWGSVSSVIASYPKDNSRKHHCFIQKGIVGAEKTIIFAAVEGELTGCLLLTKQLNTSDGKVWGGELAVVPPIVVEALREYLNDTKWTGGGELEFIETHTDRLRVDPGTLPTWYLIDFNTRFPAWVNAVMQCADGGCNLPMDLVAHMTLKRKFGEGYVWQGFTAYENFEPALFTRTVSEIAVTKVNAGLHFSQISSAGSGAITKGSNIADRDTSVPEPASLFKPPEIIPMVRLREKSITEIMDDDDCDASSVKLHITSDLANVCKTATSLIERVGDDLLTPQYVLSLDTIKKSLKNHCSFINAAVTKAVSDSSNPLRLQMYLSVKTQPHVDVLVAAKDMGYFAECISMGEVRAALAAGFSAEQIILTGPGKFWDTISAAESKKIGLGREGAKLAGLFADSVEDLRTLLRRLSDPEDWLDCNMLGVRFKNVGGARSRFGVDGSNPYILQTIGELCRRHMPPDMKLGVHFHFAASAPSTGLPKWYGMAGANADLASKFATLCGRDVIDSVDFGGGWNSHVVDGGVDGIRNLASMISRISNPSALHTTCIQFELGKCISERAGGMICTILEIRELDIGAPQYTLRTDANTIADGFDLEYRVEESDDSGGEDEDVLKLKVKRRAIVVDSCIGEISSPHMHPLFWRNTHDKEAKGHCDWRPIGHGKDEVWGRTCMEFDVLSGFAGGWGGHGGTCGATYGCKVTSDMRPGDQILIACCGAYDMSMQYDFGEGKGRDIYTN